MKKTNIWCSLAAVLTMATGITSATQTRAVESGNGAYMLGSRDSFAGIVPGPGTYVGTDWIYYHGSITHLAIGGIAASSADIDVKLFKLSVTHAWEATLWGGAPAININIPYAKAGIDFTGNVAGLAGGISDSEGAFGDITITPMVGWHQGNFHHSVALSIFVPVGQYSPATVDVPSRTVSALSIGKNVWALQPIYSATYFNPKTGYEFSGAAGVLFSEKNDATNYQTAPQFSLEMAALKHNKTGFAYGLQGYFYQQLGDDSGSGADAIKTALGINSLEAQKFGLGPMITFSGKMFGKPTSFKFKYTKEFDAKKTFESDVFWFNATMAF